MEGKWGTDKERRLNGNPCPFRRKERQIVQKQQGISWGCIAGATPLQLKSAEPALPVRGAAGVPLPLSFSGRAAKPHKKMMRSMKAGLFGFHRQGVKNAFLTPCLSFQKKGKTDRPKTARYIVGMYCRGNAPAIEIRRTGFAGSRSGRSAASFIIFWPCGKAAQENDAFDESRLIRLSSTGCQKCVFDTLPFLSEERKTVPVSSLKESLSGM